MKNSFSLVSNFKTALNTFTLFIGLLLILNIQSCTVNMDMKTAEQKEREMALKYKIRAIKLYQKDYRVGVALPEYLSQVRTYDENGLRIKELNYNDSVSVHSLISYEFDKNWNLVLSTSKGPDSGLIFREVRKYNDQNKRTELIFYLPDGTYKYRNVSTYDGDGNLIQLAYYWPEGLRCINKYSYKKGLKTADTEFDPQGRFNYKWLFYYDKCGNQTEAIQYYPDSVISARTICDYDDQNRLIKQIDYMGESVRLQSFFTYDLNGLTETKKEVSPAGNLMSRVRFEYVFYK